MNARAGEYAPLKPSVMPEGPWEVVSCDFCGTLADQTYYMVVTCMYSRWFDVRIVRTTSCEVIIPQLRDLFATHGTPAVLMSDNGAPFGAYEFAAFAKAVGFEHRRVTPLWPQANGAVESIMKKLKRVEAIIEQ